MKRIILVLGVSLIFAGPALAGETNALPVLTLAAAEQLALHNHPQIAAADFRVLAAQEAVKETRAGYYPTASLAVNAVGANDEGTRILAGGLNNPSVYDRAAGGIAVSQLITDFGRTANLAATSKFQAEAEGQNARATREQILLRVKVGYLNALQARAVLQVAQQTLDTRQTLLDQVSVLASNKFKSDLDVSFARVAVQEARLLLQKAQSDAEAALLSLTADMGERETKSYRLVEPPAAPVVATNDVAQLVQTALSDRPELMSLHNQNEAAQSFARSQRDARLPTIAAFGVAGVSPIHDDHLDNNYAVGGLQLTIPLFAGGLYTARQHEAELKSQADLELLRAAENDIVRDVHLAWFNVINAVDQLKTTTDLVRNAGDAYELANARYKIGSGSIVELSQAQLALTSAQITETSARYNLLIQQANLSYEVGALK